MSIEPIKDPADWITRSKECSAILVSKYGYHPDDFHIVDPDDEPALDFSSVYPKEWGRYVTYDANGDVLRGFVRHDRIPSGLTLHWPSGLDCCGEAFDPKDPIFLLEDAELWETFVPDEYDGE